jgi:beta-lactamase regulating signal transducer with metallopeptidase domain
MEHILLHPLSQLFLTHLAPSHLSLAQLSLSQLAAASLLATAWQTLLLASVVALYLRLLPRLGPEVRYAMWAAMLPVTVVLFVLSIVVHRSPQPAISPLAPVVLHLDIRWSIAIASIWMLLSLVRAVNLARNALHLRAIAKAATPVTPHHVFTTRHQRSAILCTTNSDAITQPSVLGFLSPRILIPARMYASLTPSELDQIILHEMEHLRRHDDWMNLAQKLSLVLFPLNPGLYWVERRLCRERELACDDGVLRQTAAPKLYATCLVHLAEQRLRFRQMPLALGAWARQSELAGRIDHILHHRSIISTGDRPQAMAALTTLAIALLGGAAALSRSPQIISFAPVAVPSSSMPETVTIPASFPSADVKPVVFHPTNGAGLTRPIPTRPGLILLKAVMPTQRLTETTRPFQAGKVTKALRSGKQRHLPKQQPSMVLTSWAQPSQRALPSSRMIFAVEEQTRISYTYAAVPTAGGWIVLQL